MKTPELLLPAGSLDKMRAAYAFGADAVYAGQPRYSLRARNNEFRLEQLAIGIAEAHAQGKAFFVTSNLIAHNDKVRTYLRDIEPVMALKPDALIMADPGLIMQVRERWPEMAIHLSVQANTTNWATVKFWQSVGIRRIILSRELSLDEIAAIRDACPDMELEVFVHGALCIAYSGRCLLSGYFNRRDPNQGTCTNACRWKYDTQAAHTASDSGEAIAVQTLDIGASALSDSAGLGATCGGGRHPAADEVYLIEEENRKGEWMPIMEDEHGTYILNSKDLRAVEHVARLVAMGIDSLKIEGRTKSRYYVARTAQVYRRAIDDAVAGRPFNPDLLRDLESLAHRGYTTGLLDRKPQNQTQNYAYGHSEVGRARYVGDVLQTRADGWSEVIARNRFDVGDTVEVIHPQGNRLVRIEAMQNSEGEAVSVAPGDPHRVWVSLGLPAASSGEGAMLTRLCSDQRLN